MSPTPVRPPDVRTLDVDARTSLGIYSAERSLIDIVRIRHLQGSDIAWEALRRWIRQPGASPARLIASAEHFVGAESAIRKALEVLCERSYSDHRGARLP